MLIAARALLGIAGATIAPSTLSLITKLFQNPRQRTFAVGVWITSYSAGAAIGPRGRRRAAVALRLELGLPARPCR